MPEICRIGSVRVVMYFEDHGGPHFHVIDGRRRDKFYLETMEFEYDRLQQRKQREILRWARVREAELHRAWQLVMDHKDPGRIAPLD
ncbi:MAG: DUF4160 domain-containing protein [Chloroflexi bacterium]|nr:DUF4160 domain-containing protein [Chloroflexota bacterium]MYG91158.1 DUF4160 domain-containing protein [Chloroflexota bacterium]MYJ92025.1 DUF4160 domain-containing protein [Chloroflexota bacterium]